MVRCLILFVEGEIVDFMDVVDLDVVYIVRWFVVREVFVCFCEDLFNMVCVVFLCFFFVK